MNSKLASGLIAGLGGGIVCGIIWSVMRALGPFPMIEVVGAMFGKSSFTLGWVIHILFSAAIGGVFGYLLSDRIYNLRSALRVGGFYGLFSWMASGLILQPMLIGLPAFAPVTIPALSLMALSSLIGFSAFGLVMGVVFFNLYEPARDERYVRSVMRERLLR